jgi:hypothetical protein
MPAILRRRMVPLIIILWLATGLRFYQLETQSFWNDEGNSARLSERSVSLIVEGTAADVHPPLYYLLLRGWRELIGESEFGLRSLSAFAGVLTVAGTAALGLAFGAGRSLTAVIAAAVTALHPALVYYGQEARMYGMVTWLGIWSTLILWRWLDRGGSGRLAIYGLSLAAGLYTHYIFPAILPVHVGLMLWRARHRAQWLGWLSAGVGATVLFLPWFSTFRAQIGSRPAAPGSPFAFLEEAFHFLVFGETLAAGAGNWGLVGGLLLILLVLYATRRRPAWLIPIAGALAPVLLMLASGATRPAYHKFLVLGAPFVALLMARGAALGWETQVRVAGREASRLVTAVLVGLVLVTGLQSLRGLYFDPAHGRADYRAMAERIESEAHPDAGIILNAPNQWEVFTYYYQGGAPVYPLPQGEPEEVALSAALSRIAREHRRLYVVFWGEAERDPQRLVERWLDANAFKATETWYGDVRFVTYAVPGAAAGEMAAQADWQFGQAIRLLGYTVDEDWVRPGDIVTVTLFWEATEPVEARYKVFLHLVGPVGLIAQRDSEPGGWLALTTTWEPGRQVIDRHGVLVPPDAPPGRYDLRLGLYALDDPTARLPIQTPAGMVDAVDLIVVRVGRE